MSLDGFLLMEEPAQPAGYDRHGEMVLPALSRRPTDPGFVLTWAEYRGPRRRLFRRTGVVLTRAPEPGTVWVTPDHPIPGDGCAVVVQQVTEDSAAEAVRHVGGPGDYRSTAEWQAVRTLPPAWIRTDRITPAEGGAFTSTMLHARRRCARPIPGPGVGRRGRYRPAAHCWVFQGWLLHDLSQPPLDELGEPVRLCGCLSGSGRR